MSCLCVCVLKCTCMNIIYLRGCPKIVFACKCMKIMCAIMCECHACVNEDKFRVKNTCKTLETYECASSMRFDADFTLAYTCAQIIVCDNSMCIHTGMHPY